VVKTKERQAIVLNP